MSQNFILVYNILNKLYLTMYDRHSVWIRDAFTAGNNDKSPVDNDYLMAY